jgi:hypothetical protein
MNCLLPGILPYRATPGDGTKLHGMERVRGFESPQLHREVFTFCGDLVHVWVLVIFASGSDILRVADRGGLLRVSVRAGCAAGLLGVAGVFFVPFGVAWCWWRLRWGCRRLWRPGGGWERGEGLAPAVAGSGGQAFGGAAPVVFLPGVPGGQDALVADDEQGGGEQHQGG